MRIVKKISLILLLFCCMLFIIGCDDEKKSNVTSVNGTTTIKETIVDENFNENGSGTLKCTTEAYANDGIEVDVNYTITYRRSNILELHSVQKVLSDVQSNLDEYEKAFERIALGYEGLKYYDTSLIRDSNSVTYDIIINYDKIDIDELLDIEGEEDNIIKNGKAKLSLWLDLAGRLGTTCEEV